jgi:SAM-dependent methyltransferase
VVRDKASYTDCVIRLRQPKSKATVLANKPKTVSIARTQMYIESALSHLFNGIASLKSHVVKGVCMVARNNTRDNIKDFWEKMGTSKPAGELVTHRDIEQVALEIDTIMSLLNEEDILLDIGCGSGFSTAIYARKCEKATGIDYAKTMVESARHRYGSKKLRFEQQDVLTLNDRSNKFSVIVSTRCLINLGSWDEQKNAMQRLHTCLKPGGRFVLAEGTKQGRDALNGLRRSVGLNPMPPVWHNIDFDEDLLMPFLADLFDIQEDIRFGLYDVLTRVNYPLIIHPDEPRYETSFHRAASELAKSIGDDPYPQYSREFVMVLRKR